MLSKVDETSTKLVFKFDEDKDKTFTKDITILFESTTEDLLFKDILLASEATFTATSEVRTLSFAETTDFTVDRTAGSVTIVGTGSIIADSSSWHDGSFTVDGSNVRKINYSSTGLLTELFPFMLVEVSTSTGLTPEWYMVISVTTNTFILDTAKLIKSELQVENSSDLKNELKNELGDLIDIV
jgi:hypothetical protein